MFLAKNEYHLLGSTFGINTEVFIIFKNDKVMIAASSGAAIMCGGIAAQNNLFKFGGPSIVI